MPLLLGPPKAAYVRDLFSGLAPRYDLMNRLVTAGQDIRWRQEVIRLARLQPGDHLLDLGAGTGDLAHEALCQQPQARVTAADFALQMMRAGQRRGPLAWCGADALRLPFHERTFDAMVSGFLMRNVADADRALSEQFRILKAGGRLVILDTTRPRRTAFSPFIRFHMRLVVPALGGLLAGSRSAYRYLSECTEGFLSAEELAARIGAVGFASAKFRLRMFGAIAIHTALRSA